MFTLPLRFFNLLSLSLVRPLTLTLMLAACGAASEATKNFATAMGSGDATIMREAVKALASKDAGTDDEILPLLVKAVGDRQTSEAAIATLRARTGLAPASKRGQSHYPNYPSGDTASDWSTWLAERSREKDQEAKVKNAEKTAKEAKKIADKVKKKADGKDDGKDDKDADTDAVASATKAAPSDDSETKKHHAPPAVPPEDLGKLDRIVFKNGSSLVCYILTRRTDADGNLLSVRIVHPDGAGEEILAASLIARIEEDVK